ncbi:MAG: hypothetical protein ACOYIR_06415 [Christensenellales bacterium]|jgi:hypothetical protein
MKKGVSLPARVLLVAALVFALLYGAASVSQTADERGADTIRQAVLRAAVNCYAIEGAYPENLNYLKKHYGLRYDERRYLVSYDAFSQNLLPDVFVFVRGGADVER